MLLLKRDPKRFRALLREIQVGCKKAGLFKGMTEEEILEKMRQTREDVFNELKHASGSRR